MTDYVGVSQDASIACSDEPGVQPQVELPPGRHSIQIQSEQEVDFTFRAETVTSP